MKCSTVVLLLVTRSSSSCSFLALIHLAGLSGSCFDQSVLVRCRHVCALTAWIPLSPIAVVDSPAPINDCQEATLPSAGYVSAVHLAVLEVYHCALEISMTSLFNLVVAMISTSPHLPPTDMD